MLFSLGIYYKHAPTELSKAAVIKYNLRNLVRYKRFWHALCFLNKLFTPFPYVSPEIIGIFDLIPYDVFTVDPPRSSFCNTSISDV
jgi:hypothetical protein